MATQIICRSLCLKLLIYLQNYVIILNYMTKEDNLEEVSDHTFCAEFGINLGQFCITA